MPALLTHYCFARRVLGEDAPKAALVGGQGPDVFFFYGRLPFRKRKPEGVVDVFGRRLHKVDPAAVYPHLFKLAAESNDKAMFSDYLDGLLLHYCLDRACHPYIFYKSGKSYDPKLSRLYSISHMYFETIIDVLISKKDGVGISPDRCLELDDSEAAGISLLWQRAEEEAKVTASLPGDCFSGGLRDYRTLERLILSRSGIKRGLLKLFFGRVSEPYAMCYPRSLSGLGNIDFLNEAREAWLDPVTGVEHRESFEELMEKAKADFFALRAIKDEALEGEDLADVTAKMARLTGGINHDGSPLDAVKTHFGLVWDVE